VSNNIIICAVGGGPMPTTPDQIADAIIGRWGADAVGDAPLVSSHLARTLQIRNADGRFQIDIEHGAGQVSADGTPEQNEVVACLVRSTMPADAPRIIAFDGSWGWHAELVAGITPQTFADHVVEHDEQWVDPDLQT